jgi:hypothetical protein
LKAKPETALERSLCLIFRDKDRPHIGILPEWERTFVGDKCVVLKFQDTIVAGDRGEHGGSLGKIFTSKLNGEFKVRLELPLHYDYRKSNGGKKTPIYDDLGNPLHQIMLLLAARSEGMLDKYFALSSFIRDDKELADQLLAVVETPTPAAGFEANDTHPLMSLVADPLLFRRFVDQWELKKFKDDLKDKTNELGKWRTAALKTLIRRKEISDPDEFEVTSHHWVFQAIEKAARLSGGLPEIAMHREIVNNDRKKAGLGEYSESATIRNALDTLGFNWIPEPNDWEKYWKPKLSKCCG